MGTLEASPSQRGHEPSQALSAPTEKPEGERAGLVKATTNPTVRHSRRCGLMRHRQSLSGHGCLRGLWVVKRAGRRILKHAYQVRRAVGHAALHAPAPVVRAALRGARCAALRSTRTGTPCCWACCTACPCARCKGGFARRTERRFVEHAYWYAVLLGMLNCTPLRPEEERLVLSFSATGAACAWLELGVAPAYERGP